MGGVLFCGFDKVQQRHDSGDLGLQFSRELKPSTPSRISASKGSQRNSFLGRAGIVGLEKAVDVLDTFGSSMSNLNAGTGFVTGLASRGHTISILAFEVANTIAKGANLLQSLSEENIQFLKKEVLQSEGVHKLVSTNMKELQCIAASDKREELDNFSREVIRFGDLCKDPQWHNLGRYFSRLDVETSLHKQDRADADRTIQELTSLAQHTSELYHELNAQDTFDQNVRQKLEELESLNLPKKGENLMILQTRPAYLPPNIRDTLYRGLPPSVKKSLKSRLQSIDTKEERSVSQVKDEMEKKLQWLVPVAMNTTKAHQGFGWVGEWANTGNEFGRSGSTNNTLTRLQTLYHANKQKTDAYILELVAWLHQLTSLAKQRDFEFKPKPVRSPTSKGLLFHSKMQRFLSLKDGTKLHRIELCEEDRNLLNKVTARRLIPGVSKSQEFPLGSSKRIKVWALSRSTGNSPDGSFRARNLLKHAQTNRLDVMDGLDLAT
ncbi:peptidyl-prolyl cis-trans isomerase isoform 1 [Hibiscus syriacus]|uniref:Peptidyl-prolyl cis-trans isomerase isoform 1 n=1 Tax=Hibiscus syriacus TaxID=106335 RepID=A0A6A2YI44_HIBSY|nr:peptidyl-prolyl cis-trans isomerase isoform 1 [Hibiscus syriacus]